MDPDPKAFAPEQGDVLSFGSISLIDNPGADNITAFALAHADTTMIALDPNARPSMTPDVEDWRGRIEAIAAKAGVIRLSDEDLEFLAPGQSPADFAAEKLGEAAGLVVVTLGENGALGFCADGSVEVEGRPAAIVDSVGAGDTLMGGMMAELMLRDLTTRATLDGLTCEALGEILRYGVTAAAMNCEQSGCAPPPRADVLQRLASEA
jgi:fructokinase